MWAAYAAGTMALGFRLRLPLARRAALGLLGLVFIKVLMADTAGLSTPYRILAAILVGFILLALSFLYYRFKDRILAQPGAGKPSR